MAREIAAGRFEIGQHIVAQSVADRYGVSRSPVRHALEELAMQGLIERRENRGYFVAVRPAEAAAFPVDPSSKEAAYHAIAADRRDDTLPTDVSEQLLRERYGLSKAKVKDVMLRAVREGWAERKPGYGWRFLDVAQTPKSFRQIYEFRMAIEPAAMLVPEYSPSAAVLDSLAAEQSRMLDRDVTRQNVEDLLNAGTRFHEELIKFSGNPYFHSTLVQINRMRRLFEYETAFMSERFQIQCRDHLHLIELLRCGEIIEASYAMRRHLAGALTWKQSQIANDRRR
ncbi:GntR family transcriptional regulator [Acuticoccus sediminis]|uniref:GntR family transcriptional regulator n=2 Tax=Acuticoccus sediminis TaxID=2184697 RepID=A0A8B2P5X1_9HYPH|nr:GntR family transcriptional regulator [Acuticoccus sediminis]